VLKNQNPQLAARLKSLPKLKPSQVRISFIKSVRVAGGYGDIAVIEKDGQLFDFVAAAYPAKTGDALCGDYRAITAGELTFPFYFSEKWALEGDVTSAIHVPITNEEGEETTQVLPAKKALITETHKDGEAALKAFAKYEFVACIKHDIFFQTLRSLCSGKTPITVAFADNH
jgi:hypothetical protein